MVNAQLQLESFVGKLALLRLFDAGVVDESIETRLVGHHVGGEVTNRSQRRQIQMFENNLSVAKCVKVMRKRREGRKESGKKSRKAERKEGRKAGMKEGRKEGSKERRKKNKYQRINSFQ